MFKRMGHGLRNSPLTSQRLINSSRSDLIGKSVFSFLDNVIIASKNLQEHFHTLSLVLSRFQVAGLKNQMQRMLVSQTANQIPWS